MIRTIVIELTNDFRADVKSTYQNSIFRLARSGSKEFEFRPISSVLEFINFGAVGSSHIKISCKFESGESFVGVCSSELFSEINSDYKASMPKLESTTSASFPESPSFYDSLPRDQKQALIVMPLFLLLVLWIGYKVLFNPANASEKAYEKKVSKQRHEAALACRDYAVALARHPSTVDFSMVLGLAAKQADNGRWRVQSTFTAKNSFGVELKHKIYCLVERGVVIDGNVSESG